MWGLATPQPHNTLVSAGPLPSLRPHIETECRLSEGLSLSPTNVPQAAESTARRETLTEIFFAKKVPPPRPPFLGSIDSPEVPDDVHLSLRTTPARYQESSIASGRERRSLPTSPRQWPRRITAGDRGEDMYEQVHGHEDESTCLLDEHPILVSTRVWLTPPRR